MNKVNADSRHLLGRDEEMINAFSKEQYKLKEKERIKERRQEKKQNWLVSLIGASYCFVLIDFALCMMFWLTPPVINCGVIKILLYLNVIGLPICTIITRIAFSIWTHPKEY